LKPVEIPGFKFYDEPDQGSRAKETRLKIRYLLILLFILLFLFEFWVGSAAAADLGPGYTYWSSFKPGTMVSFRCLMTGSWKNRNMMLTVRLKSVDPDRAVLGYEETPRPGSDAAVLGKEVLIEFRASEFSRVKEDLFHGVLSTNIIREMGELEAQFEEGAEELTIKGIPIRTDRIRNVYRPPFKIEDARNQVTIWRSDEIPGKLAKIVREIRSHTEKLREEVTAVDFLALPAPAEEIARLRAARTPVWVEASAVTILLGETRYFEDLENLQKFNDEWDRVMRTIVPFTPISDMGEFSRCYSALREKIQLWKAHWAEDRPSIEARLEPSGIEKIRPLLEAMSRSLKAFDKQPEWMDRVLFLINASVGLENLRPLEKELPGFQRDADALIGKLLEELKNLQSVILMYRR
jgi:hypothetical protein